MLGLHVALLVTDSYVDVSLPGALVPFTAGYRAFALGLGTLAAYGLLVVAADRRGPRPARGLPPRPPGPGARCTSRRTPSGCSRWATACSPAPTPARWWAWALYGGCALAVVAAPAGSASGAADAHAQLTAADGPPRSSPPEESDDRCSTRRHRRPTAFGTARLLAGVTAGRPADLAAHRAAHGEPALPRPGRARRARGRGPAARPRRRRLPGRHQAARRCRAAPRPTCWSTARRASRPATRTAP